MQQLAHDCSHILDQLIHPYALLALKKLRSLSEGKKFGNCCRVTTNIKFTMLALFDGFTEIQENELPEKLIALVIREDGFDERFPAIAAKRAAAAKT
jgi:hypothetical protein